MHTKFYLWQKLTPPPHHLQQLIYLKYYIFSTKNKDASISIIKGKLLFYAMYLKHLIVTPIPLKVNQSSNKTSE